MTRKDFVISKESEPRSTLFKQRDAVIHQRTGGLYVVVMTPEDGCHLVDTGEPGYVYCCPYTGKYWVRSAREMEDGRFIDPSVNDKRDYINHYHHVVHCSIVGDIAASLAKDEGYSEKDQELVRIAGLYHDCYHSGGRYPDWINIDISIGKVVDIYRKCTSELDSVDIQQIIDTIRCTEYPFVHEPTTGLQKCLRDADLLYAIDGDHIDVMKRNLELCHEMIQNHPMTLAEFGKRNVQFRQTCTYFTSAAKLRVDAIEKRGGLYWQGGVFETMTCLGEMTPDT